MTLVSDAKTKQTMPFVSGSEVCFFLHKIRNFFQSPLFFCDLYQNVPLQINVPRWFFFPKKCYRAGTSIRDRRVDLPTAAGDPVSVE